MPLPGCRQLMAVADRAMGGGNRSRWLLRASPGPVSCLLVFDTSHGGSKKAHRDQRLLLSPRVCKGLHRNLIGISEPY